MSDQLHDICHQLTASSSAGSLSKIAGHTGYRILVISSGLSSRSDKSCRSIIWSSEVCWGMICNDGIRGIVMTRLWWTYGTIWDLNGWEACFTTTLCFLLFICKWNINDLDIINKHSRAMQFIHMVHAGYTVDIHNCITVNIMHVSYTCGDNMTWTCGHHAKYNISNIDQDADWYMDSLCTCTQCDRYSFYDAKWDTQPWRVVHNNQGAQLVYHITSAITHHTVIHDHRYSFITCSIPPDFTKQAPIQRSQGKKGVLFTTTQRLATSLCHHQLLEKWGGRGWVSWLRVYQHTTCGLARGSFWLNGAKKWICALIITVRRLLTIISDVFEMNQDQHTE